MRARIQSFSPKGSITIPPSKSLAHRALICAALAKGTSRIDHLDFSQDVLATLNAIEKLGAKIDKHETYVLIEGIDQQLPTSPLEIDCFESGSTLRFLIPLLSLTQKQTRFKGQGKLLSRPLKPYQELFTKQGLSFNHSSDELIIEGALKPQAYQLKGNVSSQFISGLLFALPLLWDNNRKPRFK
jgi:3-phosphoshikimate 1-carboxyvinyltransferase